ncbi:hypothetical protein AURDEDRAFT_128946 [Auricularia subglabra TFB-10046 SS5]|nr:hypothetical protein AURDEDRAFT_128946 [Auricularia subglabra TFB-10046 SS5]
MSYQLNRRNAFPDLRAHFRALEAAGAVSNGTPLTADRNGMRDELYDVGSSMMNHPDVGTSTNTPEVGLDMDGYASDGTVATCGSEEQHDAMFADLDSRAVSPIYPLTGCDEDVVFSKINHDEDDDAPPPAYSTVSTRYSLAGDEIIQDDLRPVQRNAEAVKCDVYRPPALRASGKPDEPFQDVTTIREAINALDFAARNPQRTMNIITKLSTEDRLSLTRMLGILCPRNDVTFRIDPIAAVIAAWPKYMGISYDVRFANGRTARIRDIDAWRSPNGRIMIALFWGKKTRVLSVEDIDKLLLLPQYRAEGGFFLQAMKAELLKGT